MRFILLIALLSGCVGYIEDVQLDVPLLDNDAVARDGRVYMLAPATDALIEVDPTERSHSAIELSREPRVLSRPAGSERMYALGLVDATLSRIDIDGSVTFLELGAPFNRLDWSPDGTRAFLWIDPAGVQPPVEGSLNLGAYAVLVEREDGPSLTPGGLTFEPLGVTFSADSSKALVSTTSRLHVLDLEVDPVGETMVPLTIDDSIRRTPDLVVPTPDGARALVTVEGRSDLFVLSLDPVLIENVVALPRAAADIALSRDASRAIIADGSRDVTFLDLSSYDADLLNLPHTVNRVLPSRRPENDFALLYSDVNDQPFLSRVQLGEDTVPDDPDTWLMDDGVRAVSMEPGETAAVVFHEGGAGTQADSFVPSQSLSLFSFDERAPSRILLDAAATDLVFLEGGVVAGSEDPHVMVVLRDSARLVRYNLRDYSQVVLDTYSAPTRIGRIPPADGGSEQLYVVHDHELGLVSFVDPAAEREPPGGFPAVAGLATNGILEVAQ